MATGYTHPVKDGEITTLSAFIARCAPAVIYQMRDYTAGAPIPQVDAQDMLRAQARLTDAELEVDHWTTASGHELAAARDEHAAEWLAHLKEANQQNQDTLSRYTRMRTQVRAWEPPPELEGLRDFMMGQLDESIKWDTTAPDDYERQFQQAREAGQEPLVGFQDRMVADAQRRVQRAQEDLEKARERYAANLRFRTILLTEMDKVRKGERGDAATGE